VRWARISLFRQDRGFESGQNKARKKTQNMKNIRLALLIGAGLFASLNLHAQTAKVGRFNHIGTPIQSAAPDSIVAVTADTYGLALVAPEDLPRSGTFWLITSNGVMAPMPGPLLDQNLPTYFMADGQFLVDGTGGQVAVNTRRLGMQVSLSSSVDSALSAQQTAIVNLINQAQGAQVNREFSMAMGMGVPTPGDGGDSGGGVSPNGLSVPLPDYGTNLWLELANVANGRMNGLIHNSSPLVPYTIYSKPDLLLPAWTTETTFYGSGITTNLTPFALPALERGMLFLRAIAPIAPRIIGAGMSHNVVIRRDGTVWAWGGGSSGQLGNGQWNDTNPPVLVTGLSNIVALAAPPDGNFNLALDSVGKVWSWGQGDYGQLGRNNGLYANTNLAARVPMVSNIVAIAGGQTHALALKSDGTVWAWGDNSYGQLGDTNTYGRDYPARVTGLTNAIAIASGADHCFALCANGTVQGWGYNGDGELGMGNTTDQPLPALVPALTNVVALSGGYFHSIALLANGTVKAWGDNLAGEIGSISSSTPVSVTGLSNIISIASGSYHNLFLNTNGALYTWGNDDNGQLGDNGANSSTNPFLLTTVSNVTAIAGGDTSSMISTADGSLYVWGYSGFDTQTSPFLVNLYTNYSSDGSGLPDWWQVRYFGHLGVDPSADPDGDGWNNLQEYVNGSNPTNFDAPPAVTGLVATQGTNSTDVTLTWNAATPTPESYVIYRYDYNYTTWQYGAAQAIGQVSGTVATSQMVSRAAYSGVRPMDAQNNTLSFVDNGSVAGGDGNSVYDVDAVYGGGTAPVSAQAYINSALPAALAPSQPITVNLVRNATGRWQLMFAALPSDVQTIQLNWTDTNGITAPQTINPSSLTNGIYRIPDADVVYVLGNSLSVQATATNGTSSASVPVGTIPNDAPYFVDGRQHMKQNLSFLIRSASLHLPFGAFCDDRLNQSATNFEEFSFLHHDTALDNLWPFSENCQLENYLLNTSRTNMYQFPIGTNIFNFQPDFATSIPAPPVLAGSDPCLILQPGFFMFDGFMDYYHYNSSYWGVNLTNTNTIASLQSGLHNLFGLPYQTGCEVDLIPRNYRFNDGYPWLAVYQSLAPGSSVTIQNPSVNIAGFSFPYMIGTYASQCPAPTLQFVNYYFAPLLNPNANPMDLPAVDEQPSPLPIDDAFAVTNQTPAVMFGAVGQPMILGGWAKYSIQGSSPTKYAYLGQYFTTNAFKVDASGNVTSTNTGIVSPYGELFPTEPGPLAMVTMPDIDTGLQATGRVQVISLAMDANQDGTIDPTYNGLDTVSATRPFRFWANNNYDRWTPDTDDGTNYMDDVASTDVAAISPYYAESRPDYDYCPIGSNRQIPCTRDLEDFARLWVCGLTTNVLAALPSGCTVTLNWGDVGNPNSGNPTIDLFQAVDSDGGIGYLTNATSAARQIVPAYATYVGRLAPGKKIQLNDGYFGGWAGNHYIWCGVTNGTGKLNLTIADAHSNVLAQTSTYIQLVDIKQMYERWTVGENPSVAPTTYVQLATNDLPATLSRPFRYSQPGDASTPYTLFVHGWNMETWEKDRFAETAFKRLYWQGYQGRFGSFRWPTGFGFTGWKSAITDPDNYDNSESNAWASARGLLNKLVGLNMQYPDNVYLMAHSMGNVVVGEALHLAGTNQVANTYIAMQGAVPAHCYDPTTYVRTNNLNYLGVGQNSDAPNYYASYWTNGAPCYFNGTSGAGRYIDFYNIEDFALARWQVDQDFKPDSNAGFYYDDSVKKFYFGGMTELHFPADTYRIFAYCDTAFCYALGAQENVSGAFNQSLQLNLFALPYDFGRLHIGHSHEFRSDTISCGPFWDTLLIRMQLK
jgi:alpha-tubulin suppressor-like RCC1 family protein